MMEAAGCLNSEFLSFCLSMYSCFHELRAPSFSSLVESIFAHITSIFHKTCFKEGPKLYKKITTTLKEFTEKDKFQDFKWGLFAATPN